MQATPPGKAWPATPASINLDASASTRSLRSTLPLLDRAHLKNRESYRYRGEPIATDSSEELPYATGKSLRVFGKIRDRPDDFVVDELPAYAPEGHGNHLFVRFQKTGLNTQDAVRQLAAALRVDANEA